MQVIQLRREIVDALLNSGLGAPLLDLEQDIDRDLQPRSALLAGWTASLGVNVSRPGIAVKNVVGVLEGLGPLAQETVVIWAHYDHLAYRGFVIRAPTPPQTKPAPSHPAPNTPPAHH